MMKIHLHNHKHQPPRLLNKQMNWKAWLHNLFPPLQGINTIWKMWCRKDSMQKTKMDLILAKTCATATNKWKMNCRAMLLIKVILNIFFAFCILYRFAIRVCCL